jgi:UPF0755 protein
MRYQRSSAELKAGDFELSPGWDVAKIVDALVEGKEASTLFTITPGIRIDQIKKRMIKANFNQTSVDNAFVTDLYRDHPLIAELPAGATLEGYIFPETYSLTKSSTPTDIIRQSLDLLEQSITVEMRAGYKAHGLTTFQAVTLASIVEKEVSNTNDRKVVAQIFLRRLDEGIALGSDATYYYASAVFGGEPFPDLDSPYNTRKYAGLPPGPINNVSKTALEAVAFPSTTNYLFFVTGDDGVNHYTSTEAEHNQAVKQYCKVSCATGYVPDSL